MREASYHEALRRSFPPHIPSSACWICRHLVSNLPYKVVPLECLIWHISKMRCTFHLRVYTVAFLSLVALSQTAGSWTTLHSRSVVLNKALNCLKGEQVRAERENCFVQHWTLWTLPSSCSTECPQYCSSGVHVCPSQRTGFCCSLGFAVVVAVAVPSHCFIRVTNFC